MTRVTQQRPSMPPPRPLVEISSWAVILALCLLTSSSRAQTASPASHPPESNPPDSNPQSQTATPISPPDTSSPAAPKPAKTSGKNLRAAEDAYLTGAKKLDHDDLAAAEHDFTQALSLDPGNRDYAAAISITREHRLTELVRQAVDARRAGDSSRAVVLLEQARAIDPASPILLEHRATLLAAGTSASATRPAPPSGSPSTTPLTDRARLLFPGDIPGAGTLAPVPLAGPIRLTPTQQPRVFHMRGDAQELLRQVAAAYGIRAVIDDSVQRKQIRFDLEAVQYEQAMPILMQMAHVFAVPLDETSILLARDLPANRDRLEHQLEETIYLRGMTPEQINDIANLVRNIFDIRQATVQAGLESLVLRAPEDMLVALNRTVSDLLNSAGEILIDVKLYEIDTTRTRNIGATIPTQAGIYNVEAAATSIVNANQSLIQEAIAQGLGGLTASSSNIELALALIGSGLVQSSLLSSTLGFFGNGITLTGVTASINTSFNLALNSSDTRTLDDVQMRVMDRQPATFRSGTRYPVTSSTYTTGLSTAASSLSNATINGVSVASLLAQYAGGSSATIPQVTYEDLGVTLKATPVLQKSGRINLLLDMKIEALAGSSSNGIPVLASRQFTSDITVADGEGAFMVSNMNRTEVAAVTGVPGLSELPGFQMPTDQNAELDTSQLVVVVTPHVVRLRSDLTAGPQILVRVAHDTPE